MGVYISWQLFVLVITVTANCPVVVCMEDKRFSELGALFHPVTPSTFLRDFFGKNVLHLSYKNTTKESQRYRRGLFNNKDVKKTFLAILEKSNSDPSEANSYKFVKHDKEKPCFCTGGRNS